MPKREQFKSDEDYREWYREYRNKNRIKLRDYNKKYNFEWRLLHGTERDKIRSKVYFAIKKGILKRGDCEICGSRGAEGHHFNYSKPLLVTWLCPVHHKKALHEPIERY